MSSNANQIWQCRNCYCVVEEQSLNIQEGSTGKTVRCPQCNSLNIAQSPNLHCPECERTYYGENQIDNSTEWHLVGEPCPRCQDSSKSNDPAYECPRIVLREAHHITFPKR